MRIILTLLALCLAAVSAVPSISQRIVGGELTTIDKYPSMAAVLFIIKSELLQACGGTILNEKSILTAGHCAYHRDPKTIRIRVGSSYATSGGAVHDIGTVIVHPDYDEKTFDYDIGILQTATTIEFNDVVKPVSLAGADDNVADDEKVWAVGWGTTSYKGEVSEQLRDVEVTIINQETCQKRYLRKITDNMMCAGVKAGGRDACQNDSGGPLYHNNVQVGIISFGKKCALAKYPGISARVSRFTDWIKANQ